MHSQRLLTAAVLGPLLYGILWWGGVIGFNWVLSIGIALCLFEYYSICFKSHTVIKYLGVVLGLMPVLAVAVTPMPWVIVPCLFLVLFTGAFLFIVSYAKWHRPIESLAVFLLGIWYVGFCGAHLGLLRAGILGREWILFLLVVIFSGDAGAYYVGRSIGKRKLCQPVSKGKTVEGAVGGLALNAIAAFLSWFLFMRQLDPRQLIVLAVVLGIIGQLGDLTESIVKRGFGVKDSGAILPGHGGIFDRIDAVLLAAPAIYWILHLGLVRQY